MAKDVLFINGAIAVKEKYLLKDRIFKLCEMNAEDAFRALLESGFGGTESDAENYEALIAAEERATDAFIRENAPSAAEEAYLLFPRDFHNAKALVKARFLGLDPERMLAPDGTVSVSRLKAMIGSGAYDALGKELGGAVAESEALFSEYGRSVSGAEIGRVFEQAKYRALADVCSGNGTLKKLIAAKADLSNLLTAYRSPSYDAAERAFVVGGTLKKERFSALFKDAERAERAFDETPYAAFARSCAEAKRAGLPLTEAERKFASYETDFLAAQRYDLQKNQPFLYYVFRRRAEAENVRIVFVCLSAGMREAEIKARLRTF
ncbi:MAG: V0D/AC39 family V-type ATPase subunit [Candidatus Gallimonas sp.]